MPSIDQPNNPQDGQANPFREPDEPVWTYRGYKLRPSEFTTAMVHFFRAEITRANVWRQRLDATTNWAVISTGAAITIAFNPTGFHAVIILNTLLITLFLFIEARRYRYYELWSSRVRLMETDFFAAMLVSPFHPSSDWGESLAANLLHPDFPISMWEAFGRRFRRNYMSIYLILAFAWLAKVAVLPTATTGWRDFVDRTSIGGIPGEIVLVIGIGYNLILLMIGLLTSGLHRATGEVLPRFAEEDVLQDLHTETEERHDILAWFRKSKRRRQIIAYIITDQPDALSERIMEIMTRGVTAFPAKGMYTKKEHHVLLCALTITEVHQLKQIVKQFDPQAFMIVSPAREIIGRGFIPMD